MLTDYIPIIHKISLMLMALQKKICKTFIKEQIITDCGFNF